MSALSREKRASPPTATLFLSLFLLASSFAASFASATSTSSSSPRQSRETLVLQTTHGRLEIKLWPSVAPRTAAHISKLFSLGLYTTNHFFRVDRNFVAQLADASNGGRFALDARQRAAAEVSVPLEAGKGGGWPRHDRAGLVSMARQADPDSGRSSFSVMLGPAPHLDGEYTIFGEIINKKEFEAFKREVEALPTKREGIFVMPLERVEVLNSYVFSPPVSSSSSSSISSSSSSAATAEREREECLRDLKLMEARWKAERARREASLP